VEHRPPWWRDTVHANNSAAALAQIGQLIQEASVQPPPELIAEAVVSIVCAQTGRVVEEIISAKGYKFQSGFDLEKIA